MHSSMATRQLTRQDIVDLARAAHQAPSIHNSQPWLFRAGADGLDIVEDRRRSLPGSDPRGRDRLISCGAAVRNAEVAMARLGRRPVTTLLPQGPDGDHLATITAGPPSTAPSGVQALHRAIWERRTHRRIFMASASAAIHLPTLQAAVEPMSVRLAEPPQPQRARFARLLWRSAQAQVQDAGVRAELQAWTRTTRSNDGVPLRSHGTSPFPVDGLLARALPPVDEVPPWVLEDLETSTVVVLVTPGDARLDWLQAGRGLEALLLTATTLGLVASFLNQPVEEEPHRRELAALLGRGGHPQVVLRVGKPLVTVPATPRRPLVDVLQD